MSKQMTLIELSTLAEANKIALNKYEAILEQLLDIKKSFDSPDLQATISLTKTKIQEAKKNLNQVWESK